MIAAASLLLLSFVPRRERLGTDHRTPTAFFFLETANTEHLQVSSWFELLQLHGYSCLLRWVYLRACAALLPNPAVLPFQPPLASFCLFIKTLYVFHIH